MMAQDIATLDAKMAEVDKVMNNLPGRDPTNAQMFAMVSVLFGQDIAAPLAEVGTKASSTDEARQQLPIFKRLESIVKTAHMKNFEATLDTYNKNVQKMAENITEPMVVREPFDPEFWQQFGLDKDVPVYWVLKDLHEFVMAVIDGQIKFVAISVVTR
jgi:hypothetical protein